MKHLSLRQVIWYVILLLSAVCLLTSIVCAVWDYALPKADWLLTVNQWLIKVCPVGIHTALGNTARILGTGAAFTLLAAAANQEIEGLRARDILASQYRGLFQSYLWCFFPMVFLGSYLGDCENTLGVCVSVIGAVVMAGWFLALSVSMLGPKGRQRLIFDYYLAVVQEKNDECGLSRRIRTLEEATKFLQRNPSYHKKMQQILYRAVEPFAAINNLQTKAAYLDRWDKVDFIKGAELAERAWLSLCAPVDPSQEELCAVCRDVLLDIAWGDCGEEERAALLAGFLLAWLPRSWDCENAVQNLWLLCEDIWILNLGDDKAKRLINDLLYGFGMAFTVVYVSIPSGPEREEVETVWRRLLYCHPAPNIGEDIELLNTFLVKVEFSFRKRFSVSWASYYRGLADIFRSEGSIMPDNIKNVQLVESLLAIKGEK